MLCEGGDFPLPHAAMHLILHPFRSRRRYPKMLTVLGMQDMNVGAEEVDADDVDLEESSFAGGGAAAGELGPLAQVVTIASWTTMKEACLLRGVLARTLPLAGGERRQGLLSASQLQALGDSFVHVLCSLKHNGAVEKSHLGFNALCET